MRTGTVFITIKQLLNLKFYLGAQRTLCNRDMKVFISGSRNDFCIFDLSYTLVYFRRSLFFLKYGIFYRRFFIDFILRPEVYSYFSLNSFFDSGFSSLYGFISGWEAGLLSNPFYVLSTMLTENRMSKPFYPDVVVLFELDTHYPYIMNESSRVGVPLIVLTDADMTAIYANYYIPANNDLFGSHYFIFSLIKNLTRLEFSRSICFYIHQLYAYAVKRLYFLRSSYFNKTKFLKDSNVVYPLRKSFLKRSKGPCTVILAYTRKDMNRRLVSAYFSRFRKTLFDSYERNLQQSGFEIKKLKFHIKGFDRRKFYNSKLIVRNKNFSTCLTRLRIKYRWIADHYRI